MTFELVYYIMIIISYHISYQIYHHIITCLGIWHRMGL